MSAVRELGALIESRLAATMLIGSCHCGAVVIQISELPGHLVQCTCSICRQYAAKWAFCNRSSARVTSPAEATAAYLWNDRVIEFHHCRTCGCVTHYESTDKAPDSRLAVNARMLDPAEIAGLRLRTFDGAET
ncbi:MAG: GFA family protein [Acidobacteriota bacterium]|nr:GFA family protein [Acidobacteriota bacterium]